MPQAVRASDSTLLLSSEKPEDSALRSVLRRWAKDARTVRKKSASLSMDAGGSVRVFRQTTALVTFGCGIKQLAGTSNNSSGCA